jgi:hypothetical protein
VWLSLVAWADNLNLASPDWATPGSQTWGQDGQGSRVIVISAARRAVADVRHNDLDRFFTKKWDWNTNVVHSPWSKPENPTPWRLHDPAVTPGQKRQNSLPPAHSGVNSAPMNPTQKQFSLTCVSLKKKKFLSVDKE